MATEKADVVIVGVGAAGGILAAELGKAGMKVIGLERGPRLTTQDFNAHDELRYFQRMDLRPNPKRQPVTWRPNANTPATPLSRQDYGNQAGGGTVHYGRCHGAFTRTISAPARGRSSSMEHLRSRKVPRSQTGR
jgi:gluconate 2-dehydrogenase alpha chain